MNHLPNQMGWGEKGGRRIGARANKAESGLGIYQQEGAVVEINHFGDFGRRHVFED